jgi:hypothetical protein
LTRRRRLHADAGLGALRLRQCLDAQALQHDQAVGQFERALRIGIAGDVAVQVRAGQHDDERALRM